MTVKLLPLPVAPGFAWSDDLDEDQKARFRESFRKLGEILDGLKANLHFTDDGPVVLSVNVESTHCFSLEKLGVEWEVAFDVDGTVECHDFHPLSESPPTRNPLWSERTWAKGLLKIVSLLTEEAETEIKAATERLGYLKSLMFVP